MTDPASLRLLLLHSPLVGPVSLAPTAARLRERGHAVLLPDLTGVADDPHPAWLVDRAIGAAGDGPVDVVVAHSGAGALLPTVGAGTSAGALVFLDAVVPAPGATEHVADLRQRRLLDEQTGADGRVAPWITWWPADLVAAMLPDAALREQVAAACPRVPRSLWEHPVPLPVTWAPAAYVALGAAYADELADARTRGWPSRSLGLHHLATITAPARVAAAVLEVIHDLVE